MSGVRAFVDTNVIVYLYSDSDKYKRKRAFSVFENYNCQLSTQVLNEFSHICIKKLKYDSTKIRELVELLCSYCDVAYIYEDTIENALAIQARYGYSYYDSLIIASALEQNCQYLFSEDMADGQVIEGKLTIKNIFGDRVG